MKNKEYSSLEQKLYKTPEQEAAFLSGAFQNVAVVGISIGAGWIPGLVALMLMDRHFSKPFRDDKDLRSSNLKGWIAGMVTSLAVIAGVNAYMEESAAPNDPQPGIHSETILPTSHVGTVKPV